ncbi:MAG: hydrogenase maturation protease [Chloroflexota bacterium]
MSGRVLIAGVGNELMGDDGFGIAAAQRCASLGLGAEVRVVEAGIAGIGLVHDLMDRYDTVIVLDTVDRGAPPGSVSVLEIMVPELDAFSDAERRRLLADMHYTVPSRVMILAKALGVLPRRAVLIGCQPESMELGIGLSAPVQAAVELAVERVRELVAHALPGPPATAGAA